MKLSKKYINTKGTIFEKIHKTSNGNIAFAVKSPKDEFKTGYDKFENIKIGQLNSFFSINTFTGRRCDANIFELKANFIDLDCEKIGIDKEKALYLLENDYIGTRIPKPTMILDSGNGLWLLWLYDELTIARKGKSINLKMVDKYSKVQRALCKELKDLGADRSALDLSRVMRCDKTINYKKEKSQKPKQVKVVREYGVTWSLSSVADEVLGEYIKPSEEEKERVREERAKNRKTNWNVAKTNYNRCRDLKNLLELRNYSIEKGKRQMFLFLYAYHALCKNKGDEVKTLDEVIELNSMMEYPIPTKRVKSETIKGAKRGFECRNNIHQSGYKRGGYNYKTQTIIDLLDITKEEQELLRTIQTDDLKKEKKLQREKEGRRNTNGLTPKQQEKINSAYLAQRHKDQGMTNKEIGQALEISLSTVKRLLKVEVDINLVTIDIAEEIETLSINGLSNTEIALKMNMSVERVSIYLRFKRRNLKSEWGGQKIRYI